MKRIRFFNAFDPVSPFFRSLLPHLAAHGFQIEVVISKADYRPGGELERLMTQNESIRVIRTLDLGWTPNGSINKTLIMLLYSVQAGVYSLFGPAVALNVFLPQPPLFVVWGRVLSVLRRQAFCYIEMDIFPEYLVELAGMKRNSILVRAAVWIYQLALEAADKIVVIGRCMADKLERLGADKTRLHFLPNWADEKAIVPIPHPHNRFRCDQNWRHRFIVMYAGNIGWPQYFDDLLSVADDLRHMEPILFVLVGEGVRKNEVSSFIAANNLRNICLLPFMHTQYPLAEILSAADLHFVSLRDNLTGIAVPSKSYGVFAAGRPMIYQGAIEGEVARVVSEEQVGRVVRCGDKLELQTAILDYYHQPDVCRVEGRKARRLAETVYSQAAVMQKYEELFAS